MEVSARSTFMAKFFSITVAVLSLFWVGTIRAGDATDCSIYQSIDKSGDLNSNDYYNLGVFYLRGECVKEDVGKSFEYFFQAAKMRDYDAYFYSALMLDLGVGVEKNNDIANKMLDSLIKISYSDASEYVCFSSRTENKIHDLVVKHKIDCSEYEGGVNSILHELGVLESFKSQ